MSEFFWKNLNYIVGLMAVAVLFALTIFSANLEVKDLDLWLHVRTGQYIVEHKTIPNHDVLSASMNAKSWDNHEWLFQVIAYTVKSMAGFDGLIAMQSVVVALTFLMLMLTVYRRDRMLLSVFTLLMVLMVYQTRFTIRPDIFSLLFFAIDMYILALCMNRRWAIYALGIIQLLWVNMHGFFIFGIVLILVGLCAEFIKRRFPLPYEWNTVGRLEDNEYRHMKWALLIVALMCLINPLGWHGAVYPFKILFGVPVESKIFFEHIYELQKPFAQEGLFDRSENMHYKILIVLSFFSFFFNRRRIDISVFFLWFVFLLFSLAAIRNLVFFACASYLVIMVNGISIVLDDILPLKFTHAKFKELTGIIAKCFLIFWMLDFGLKLSDHGYFNFDTFERKSEYGGVSQRSFAHKATDFMIAQNIKGNFFNDFNSGAFLIGRVYPNVKVFIDGRTELYGAKFFKDYQEIWKKGNNKVFYKYEHKYDLTGAFLNGANQEIPSAAIRLFYRLKDWKLVYFNHDAMIFLKNTPQNASIIERFGIDLAKWQPKTIDLLALGAKRIAPYPYIDRARMLMALKFYGPAKQELNEALKVAPETMEIYQMLGDIYGAQNKYMKAFINYRIAVVYGPGNKHNRMRLAWAYERLNDYAGAIKQYERLLAAYPNDDRIKSKFKKAKDALKVQWH